jgi:hypothetical protein
MFRILLVGLYVGRADKYELEVEVFTLLDCDAYDDDPLRSC